MTELARIFVKLNYVRNNLSQLNWTNVMRNTRVEGNALSVCVCVCALINKLIYLTSIGVVLPLPH